MNPDTEQQLFIDLACGERDRALRMIRRFPAERLDDRAPDCGHSGRELALEFLERAWVIEGIVRPPFRRLAAPVTIHDLSAALEDSLARSLELLALFNGHQWNETVRGPLPGERGRRAELLWLALRDLRRHSEHFAIHLRGTQTLGPERAISRSA